MLDNSFLSNPLTPPPSTASTKTYVAPINRLGVGRLFRLIALIAQAKQPGLRHRKCASQPVRFGHHLVADASAAGRARFPPKSTISATTAPCSSWCRRSRVELQNGRQGMPPICWWNLTGTRRFGGRCPKSLLLPDNGVMCALRLWIFAGKTAPLVLTKSLLDERLFSPQTMADSPCNGWRQNASGTDGGDSHLARCCNAPFRSGRLRPACRQKPPRWELSARLLRFTFPPPTTAVYRRRRIERSRRHPAQHEFARPLTIAEIARRVGLNRVRYL